MAFDTSVFRTVLGQFATGVAIITTTDPTGEPVGLTVNSFTSLSLTPPLVLFCLARTAGSHPLFLAAPAFAVNILAADQQTLSNRFAGREGDRWQETRWQAGTATGAPLLAGCLASLECRRHSVLEGGDHSILVGEVAAMTASPSSETAGPLLYYGGTYRTLAGS